MEIETERLLLLPLTARRLELWAHDLPALERELGCHYQGEPLAGAFLQIVEGQLEKTRRDEANAPWHSFWLLIRKEDRVIVGSADFKAPPDGAGEVEIGYGLGKAHQHRGYMGEAVAAMCRWALAQQGVRHVVAETEPQGHASQRLLQRCGFHEYRRDKTVWWRL